MAEHEAEKAEDEARARGEATPERGMGRPLTPNGWYFADIEQDNAYIQTCRNGHEMRMTLQHIRYELLFESGIIAALVGFNREAVSSIAAAQERFYEFATEVFTARVGITPEVHETAWKHAKLSERQLGAFLFLYLVNFGKPFKVGKELKRYEEQTSFRNKVIHEGYFASRTQVLDFARYVYELILETRKAIVSLDADAVRKVEFKHWHRGQDAVQAKASGPWRTSDGRYRSPTGAAYSMMLKSGMNGAPDDFDSRLSASKANLWLWGFRPPEPNGENR